MRKIFVCWCDLRLPVSIPRNTIFYVRLLLFLHMIESCYIDFPAALSQFGNFDAARL